MTDDPCPSDSLPDGGDDPNARPSPVAVMVTIDITEAGRITCWTASRLGCHGSDDWRLVCQILAALHSHSLQVSEPTYFVLRDVLRYLTEADWQPGTVL